MVKIMKNNKVTNEEKQKEIMKKVKIIFVIVFFALISAFGLKTLTNKKEISWLEGRTLSQFPQLNSGSLFKAEYRDQISAAFSDQIPFRNSLVKLYFLFQFQRYSGDVVEGKNDQLFAAILQVADDYYDILTQKVKEINSVAQPINDLGVKFILLSLPRKDAVMRQYLPSSYISSAEIYAQQMAVLQENLDPAVRLIDAQAVLKGGDYFFITDHHLNIRGADLLFREIVKIVQEDHPEFVVAELEDYYNITAVIVNGSFNRQIGQKIIVGPEELFIKPKNLDFSYIRQDNGKASAYAVWGDGDYNYAAAFMGGDFGETIITTGRDGLPNILFVGSSFLNVLESLSVPWFNTMVSLDYRHNTSGQSIMDYVLKYDIDYVVFCPAQSTNPYPLDSITNHLGLNK